MSTYDTQIKQVKQALAENGNRRRDLQTALGKQLLKEETEESFSGSGVQESFRKTAALRDEIPDLREQRDSLVERLDKAAELEESRREVREKIQKLEKEQQPYYEGLGKAAYDLYRRGILVGEGLNEEMQELADRDEEIRELENAIGQRRKSRPEKSLWTKLTDKGRAAVMSTSRSTKVSSLERMFKRIGSRVVQGDGLEKVAEAGFTDAADPVLQLRERIEKLRVQEKDYTRRLTRLQEELEERGAGGKTRRLVRDIESRIEAKEKEKDAAARELGEAVAASPGEEGADLGKIKQKADTAKLLEDLTATDQKDRELGDLMDRLQAGVEAERLDKVIRDKEKRVSRLNTEIEERQSQVKELEEELSRAGEEKKTREKERGAVDAQGRLDDGGVLS